MGGINPHAPHGFREAFDAADGAPVLGVIDAGVDRQARPQPGADDVKRIRWGPRLWAAIVLAQPIAALAAEINIFTTRAIATVLQKVGPEFERSTGHRLKTTSDIAIRMVRRIQAGEPFDLLVAAPDHIDRLIAEGKVMAETRTDLTRSGIGVQVQLGAPKPDISSVETFKGALLAAKSIGYLKEGQSGVYLSEMLDRLGIAEAIKHKVTRPDTDVVSELVAKGEIELGMVVMTQILTTPGVELVGPLPKPLQRYIVFTAGVSTNAMAPEAARELLRFLMGPSAVAVIKSQGMEPAWKQN
jgi:molybdate transport system substrate-binding protein